MMTGTGEKVLILLVGVQELIFLTFGLHMVAYLADRN